MKPKLITLIGSTQEVRRFPIVAITKEYVIVQTKDFERVYQLINGKSLTGYDWYYIPTPSLTRLNRYVERRDR